MHFSSFPFKNLPKLQSADFPCFSEKGLLHFIIQKDHTDLNYCGTSLIEDWSTVLQGSQALYL